MPKIAEEEIEDVQMKGPVNRQVLDASARVRRMEKGLHEENECRLWEKILET